MEQKTVSLLDRLKEELTSNLEKVGLRKENKLELRKDTKKTGLIQFHFSRSWYNGKLPFYKLMFNIAESFYKKEGFSVNREELNERDEEGDKTGDVIRYLSATNPSDPNEIYAITVGSGHYKGSFGIKIEKLDF